MATKNTAKAFSVIKFVDEDNIATVSTSWIFKDEEKNVCCKWPLNKKADISSLVKKGVEPTVNWISFRCRVYKEFDNYFSARSYEKKLVDLESDCATNSGEDVPTNIGRGCRMKKNRKFSDEDDSVDQEEARRPVVYKEWEDLVFLQDQPEPDHIDQIENQEEDHIDQIENQQNDHIENLDNKNVENSFNLMGASCFCSCRDNFDRNHKEMVAKISALEEKLDRLLGITNTTTIIQPLSCSINFPLQTINELEEAEEKLHGESVLNSYRNMLNLVGGADSQKFIRRCLNRVLTDKLMVLCSYTGAKGTYRVKDLIMIREIKAAAFINFPGCSDYSSEKVMMDYLRYANSRFKKSKEDDN